MKNILLIGVVALALAACTAPDKAHLALEAAGYTEIELTGWNMFGCGEDDTYSDGFVATGPTGTRVRGVVCTGLLFKGSTVRVHERVQ